MMNEIEKTCDNCSRTFNNCRWSKDGTCPFWAPDLDTLKKIQNLEVTKMLEDK